MKIQDLVNHPQYNELMKLASDNNIDERIFEEMIQGVAARLAILHENDIKPTVTHIEAAITNWFQARQRMLDMYTHDGDFRRTFQRKVYDSLKNK